MSHSTSNCPKPENISGTRILDVASLEIQGLAASLKQQAPHELVYLRSAHRALREAIAPVYTVDERQPASVTLRKGRGSCSQRIACLEALARAAQIATRVHALFIKGEFWYPRFFLSRPFIPARVLLLWPQFFLDGWVDFDELHATTEQTVKTSSGFRNDSESLFDAVGHSSVDFFGKSCRTTCARPEHDLSSFVLSDEGLFDTRDQALGRFGWFQDTIRGRAFELVFGGRTSA